MTCWTGRFVARDILYCLSFPTCNRNISWSVRHDYGFSTVEKSVQPVKMSYNSFESVRAVDLTSNEPIIIMHGLLGSKNNWNSLSKIIHNRTKRKVITVDARNHGDSPHTAELSYDHLVEDVRQLMQSLNIPMASLIGHSMGGRAMMLCALKYPHLVKELVVVDISPVRDSPALGVMPLYFRAMRDVQLDPSLPLSAARREADRQMAGNVQDVALRQFFLANLVETENGGFRWRMNLESLTNNFVKLTSFPSLTSSFEGPTIFIGGSRSDYLKPEDHEGIKKLFPNASFKYVDDAGHWLHAEKPAEFLELVCDFINEAKLWAV